MLLWDNFNPSVKHPVNIHLYLKDNISSSFDLKQLKYSLISKLTLKSVIIHWRTACVTPLDALVRVTPKNTHVAGLIPYYRVFEHSLTVGTVFGSYLWEKKFKWFLTVLCKLYSFFFVELFPRAL